MRALFALSADAPLSPKVTLQPLPGATEASPYGWGIVWYPDNQTGALVQKDPVARHEIVVTDTDQQRFRSSTIICKTRSGTRGLTAHDTQPFSRSFAGADWTFAHNGDLDKNRLAPLLGEHSPFLEPLGRTDSELAFCYLMTQLHEQGYRQLRDVEPASLQQWLAALDQLGQADIVMSDSSTLMVYRGASSAGGLFFARVSPTEDAVGLKAGLISCRCDDPRDSYRTKVIVGSEALPVEGANEMAPGQLLLINAGAIVWNSLDQERAQATQDLFPAQSKRSEQPTERTHVSIQAEQSQSGAIVTNVRSMTQSSSGRELGYRVFDISHVTEYRYTTPVSHSTHTFRLQPRESSVQAVDYSAITISSPGERILYEDVFGNQALHLTIREPYSFLRVENRSRVKVFGRPEDDLSPARRQTTIPLAWMPWQRQLLTPFLLPPELPDSQLEELTSYAMGFVERNDYHLMDTLKDINETIYRDFTYSQGNTSLSTSAFDVYASRVGVCQDFANIFICLARLLGIPARYQMGYIYTGASYENTIQSDASHAWVEVYLPYIGWRGFDPTNGCLVMQDHIAVACGRNYRDATPTSGTLYKGGEKETLEVTVKVEEV